MLISSLIALAATSAAAGSDGDILVTASLEPVAIENAAVSATVFDQKRIETQGLPFATDLLRLAPGVSVSTSGSRGSLTEIRIRGAEARHSLLFIDGMAFNDPAAANTGRFETLVNEGLSRIEVVTGPQSALWGSEALGGVIALETPDAIGSGLHARASGEYGGDDFRRASGFVQSGSDRIGFSGNVSWIKGDGIDILGGGNGDRDGFENFTASLKAVARPGEDGEFGVAARYINALTEFDSSDPNTFLRADTADASRTKTGAVRTWVRVGLDADSPWSAQLSGQFNHSKNDNRNGATPLNSSEGNRFRVDGQLVYRLKTAGSNHALIAKAERDDESYSTRDQQYFGGTNKDVSRGRTAVIGEWRAGWGSLVTTDIAVRYDVFNRFKDATTLRANAIVHVTETVSIHGGYGEGISQPSFVDLYGFFPGSFRGNPSLRPESSKGYEAGIRFENTAFDLGLTAFSNHLTDEIVSVFASGLSSTANATGKSRRRGIELSGEARPIDGLRLIANYTYTDAQERKTAGGNPIKEARRPKHSANLEADYEHGPITVGAAIAYVGARRDTDFDIFADVTLKSYALASARIAYAISPAIEAFARIENAFDDRYQDAVGYAMPGRTAYAGLRLRLGD